VTALLAAALAAVLTVLALRAVALAAARALAALAAGAPSALAAAVALVLAVAVAHGYGPFLAAGAVVTAGGTYGAVMVLYRLAVVPGGRCPA
jgi:hypothetical protein